MLTSLVKKRLDIPNEPSEWVEIRMLSGKRLDEARAEKLNAVLATAKAMGKELAEQIREAQGQAETTDAADADPLASYDVDTVLRGGVVAWSYPVRVSPDNLADLDESTRTWLAKEIVSLTVQTEEARKGN